jgi:hypothetical protein
VSESQLQLTFTPEGLIDHPRETVVKALTIKQPWAWAITEGKTIENRTWCTGWRGTLLIHAGLGRDTTANIAEHSLTAAARLEQLGGIRGFWKPTNRANCQAPAAGPPAMALGAVIAVATLADCHREQDGCCAPWGQIGVCHWQLTNIRPLPAPLPCRGALSLWKPAPDLLAAIATHVPGSPAAPPTPLPSSEVAGAWTT